MEGRHRVANYYLEMNLHLSAITVFPGTQMKIIYNPGYLPNLFFETQLLFLGHLL